LAINDVDHTKTKVKSPQTNGIFERFHKTILQEFYQVAFRKKLYDSIDALQADLDGWLHHYNYERTHQGKMCCGRTPVETMLTEKIWREKFVNYALPHRCRRKTANCQIISEPLQATRKARVNSKVYLARIDALSI